MSTKRIERLAEAYKQGLSELLLLELRDPRLAGVYLTRVVFTPDLRLAKVYFNVNGGRVRAPDVVDGFQHSKGFLKREMSERVQMKFAPDIKFYYDESGEMQDQIDSLFRQIQQEGEKT